MNPSVHPCKDSASASPSLPKVPNMFITSMTHSKLAVHSTTDSVNSQDMRRSRCDSPDVEEGAVNRTLTRKNYGDSASEVADCQVGITRLKTKGEPVLTNSGSNPPPGMLKTEGADKPKEEHTHREPHIRKLTDLIYIGNAEVAHSEQIICRQGISSVVELSNIDQNDISFSRKSTPFCSSAAVLRLKVCKFDLLEIKSHFQEINTFVKGAIERNKKVLIVYPSDTGLSAVLALQYLMHHQGMNLAKVYNLLAREYPELQLSTAYQGLLKDLNHQLYPCDQDLLPPLSGGSSSTNAKTFLP